MDDRKADVIRKHGGVHAPMQPPMHSASRAADGVMMPAIDDRLLRLDEVLSLIPVSRSTWWAGVRTGRFPARVKIGRVSAWRLSEISKLIQHGSPTEGTECRSRREARNP